MQFSPDRRNVLKLGAAAAVLASIPVIASAAKNENLRKSMKYVDKTEKPEQRCDNCVQWIAGPDPKGPGACKIFVGDNEIAPAGWCTAWAKKA